MSYGKNIRGRFRLLVILFALVVSASACAKPAANLPKDILGVSVGMSKDDAERRLREIAKFMREDGGREQVWSLNNNPNFDYLAVGYDKEKLVRYVTAIVKPKDAQPFFFKDVGDLTKAKKEVTGPNYRYSWEIAANGKQPAYTVIAQGANADSLSLYSLKKPDSPKRKEDDDDDDQ